MEALFKKLYAIDFKLMWTDGTLLESTEAFRKLEKVTLNLKPKPKYVLSTEKYNCVLRHITAQVLRDDQYEINGPSFAESELEKGVEKLKSDELCKLSAFFGLYRKLKPDDSDDNYFLTEDDNERVNHTTVCSQLVQLLTREIEIETARLYGFLFYGTPKEFWYDLYDVEDDYSKEKVDNLVEGILRQ